MGSISPEMMQQQMNMFNSMSPEQQAEVQRQAGSVTPEQIAAGAGRFQGQAAGQQTYKFQGAQNLKAEGNRLHSAGSYQAASEKYEQAITNVSGNFAIYVLGLRAWAKCPLIMILLLLAASLRSERDST